MVDLLHRIDVLLVILLLLMICRYGSFCASAADVVVIICATVLFNTEGLSALNSMPIDRKLAALRQTL